MCMCVMHAHVYSISDLQFGTECSVATYALSTIYARDRHRIQGSNAGEVVM